MNKTFAVLLAIATFAQAEETPLVRFSELIGTSIHTQDGATLGRVDDIVMERDTGRLQFALLNKGDSIGVVKQIAPVPWEAVSIKAEKKWVVNVDRDKLPGFQPAGAPGVDVGTTSGTGLQDLSNTPKDSNPAADKEED